MWWVWSLLACAQGEPAWAVAHGSVIPSETGLDGIQTWEFFSEDWGKKHDASAFLCVRSQEIQAQVLGQHACEGCAVAYATSVIELETDCSGDAAAAPSFAGMVAMGVGPLPASERASGSASMFAWYISYDGESYQRAGVAYNEDLYSDSASAPEGWVTGQAYTLWPEIAWQL